MSAWIEAPTELERELFDTEDSKLSWRKKVFGRQDGSNLIFKTQEFRRVTDFTNTDAPLGVFVNDVAVTIDTDFLSIGEFTISGDAPTANDEVTATYYFEYFNDKERGTFLSQASSWLGIGNDYTAVQEGLRPAALMFAASKAFQNLSMRAMRMETETFRLEDAPNEKVKLPSELYMKNSLAFGKMAKDLRDQFYTREGKPLQPLHGVIAGRVRNLP